MTESSQKCPTPRQRFVEAMQRWVAMCKHNNIAHVVWSRQAAEAFADAECAKEPGHVWQHTRIGVCCDRPYGAHPIKRHDHAACRASILKEIFGE